LYFFHPQFAQFNIVRLDRERVEEGLAHIDATLKALLPDRPPVRRIFLDEAFESAYFMFTLMNRVFTGLALFALAISGAGLYGMAGFITSRRTREIGVRKTQGASAARILRLLLWDFSKPVLVANALVAPF